MKKITIFLVLCTLIFIIMANFSYAENVIVESPDVKVVIDGKITTYKDTPIIVSGRTLFPLRAILNNLGIGNENITWSNADQSVTIQSKTTEIYLKVNSNSARINSSIAVLDVAPINYKDRVYIPARFVSQSLGKKVVWDASTSSVLIRDEENYNKVKEIIGKSDDASKLINKIKLNMNAEVIRSINDNGVNTTTTGIGEFDKLNKILHMSVDTKFMTVAMNMDTYITKDSFYMKSPITGEWQKIPMQKDQENKMMDEGNSIMTLKANEVFYAGLIISESSNPDEIILKGDVYLDEVFKIANSNINLSDAKFNNFFMEVTIDKNTYLTKKAYLDIDAIEKSSVSNQTLKERITITYSDYNGNFDVTLPEGLK